jgi:hypothetical protein
MNRAQIYLVTIAFAVFPFETILLVALVIIKYYQNVRSTQYHFNIWILQANVPGGYFIFCFPTRPSPRDAQTLRTWLDTLSETISEAFQGCIPNQSLSGI